MMKYQIKHRYTSEVIFECEVDEQESGMNARHALEKAVAAKTNLSGASLIGANLSGANLSGAKKLTGPRPFMSIGPIGSRCDYLSAFITDSGVMIQAGCFFETRAKFETAVIAEHGNNNHAREYLAALTLIDCHSAIWTPKV